MVLKKNQWHSDQEKFEGSPIDTRQEGTTHFGYKEVPEDDKVKWVVRHFNAVADKYDFMNTLLSFGIHHLWKRTSVKMLELREGDAVIDICGGTGDLSLLAAKDTGRSGNIVLYDMNKAMMERGRPKVGNSLFSENISFVQGDAEKISFPDCSFDAATVGFGIRNLAHLESGLKEMYRILKPGGKFMCLEFSRPTAPLFRRMYDFYSFYIMPFLGQLIVGSRQAYTYLPESIRLFPLPSELSTILEDVGFSDVRYRRLTNGIAVVHLASKGKNPGFEDHALISHQRGV